MRHSKLRRAAGALMMVALAGSLMLAAAPAEAKKKVVTKTFLNGVGSPTGGTALTIPDGSGQSAQLVRAPLTVRGLNPRGKIRDVNVGVRIGIEDVKDVEVYLATPRGVINLAHDVGGSGQNFGSGVAGCAGQFTLFDSDTPTRIDSPGLAAPFAGSFAPLESLDLLNGLGNKKATNATWSVLVEDDAQMGAPGTLFCSKLVISATNPEKKK